MNPNQMTWEADLKKRIARKTDPIESRLQPLSKKSCSELQDKILDRLKIGGDACDAEIVSDLQMWASDSGIRTRRSELVKAGKVEDSGFRKRSPSGRLVTVWKAV